MRLHCSNRQLQPLSPDPPVAHNFARAWGANLWIISLSFPTHSLRYAAAWQHCQPGKSIVLQDGSNTCLKGYIQNEKSVYHLLGVCCLNMHAWRWRLLTKDADTWLMEKQERLWLARHSIAKDNRIISDADCYLDPQWLFLGSVAGRGVQLLLWGIPKPSRTMIASRKCHWQHACVLLSLVPNTSEYVSRCS